MNNFAAQHINNVKSLTVLNKIHKPEFQITYSIAGIKSPLRVVDTPKQAMKKAMNN